MNEHFYWYVARATGLIGWVLLTASVFWGLILSTRVAGRKPRPAWVLGVHRYLGGSALVYSLMHIASLAADSYVSFSIADLFVPMASEWRPEAVAWGIVALYILLAVEITSLVKRFIPNRVWRAVHVSSVALLLMTWVHAFTAGSDTGTAPAIWFAFGSAVLMVFLLAFRGLRRLELPQPSPLHQ